MPVQRNGRIIWGLFVKSKNMFDGRRLRGIGTIIRAGLLTGVVIVAGVALPVAAHAAPAGSVAAAEIGPGPDHSGTADEVFVEQAYGGLGTAPAQPGEGGELSTMNAQVGLNPYACAGYTQRVHPSMGFASLHAGIVDCRSAPNYQVSGTEIMKKGWFNVWHRSAFFSKEAAFRQAKLDVNAKAVCGNTSQQTYRGNGYHRVEIHGTNFSGRTSSDIETRFGCDA